MPVTTDDKQQSKSTTLPVSQLTIKKTPSLTSSQCKRHLTDKLSSGNFSSVFKLKVPRHWQDRESDVLFKSCGQSNAREIGNFQQGHRKQRKIQESFGATKSGSYKRRIMNRQQPHATLESEREKLETEEDKLGNRHNDPDHNVDTVWYKGLWWAVKKQAKKIANSNADADSSSDESVSNKTRVTKRPSGSTRNKHGKKLVSDENFIFPSSEGLKIESWEKVSYRKMVHVPPIDVFQPKQDVLGHFKLLVDNTTTSLKTGEKLVENSTIHFKLPLFRITTSEKTGEKPEEDFKLLAYNLLTTSSEKTGETLVEGREVTRLRPEQSLSPLSNNWINVLPEEVRRNFFNRSKSKHSKNSITHFKLLVDRMTTSEKTGEKPEEDFKLLAYSRTSIEKIEKLVEINVLLEEVRRNFFNRSKSKHSKRRESTEASEGSTNRPIHPVDRHTTYNSEEDNRIVMRDSMIQIPSSEVNTDISSDESWSTVESTRIRLYRNIIRNETSRMMSSIDMVGFEAEHLFGLERSRIFFDLLNAELCHFGSAGAISEFVPNMAESTVRQHVISFFEHAYETLSRLMTLLRCPDSKILQQMPVQNFISLMKSVIKSSLKAQTKGREKLSLERNIYTMVDPKNFEKELGEEIPEDVLNRLRSEDEMVVQRFVDTRQERHQPSDTRENSPIHYTFSSCIYFPSDCRLYIYIPTENGSYWHQSDMRRADRICRHSR